MKLEVKRPDSIVPEYSLTGDLLSFMRCSMQYRYYNGSSLPPSRPVQLWYGEFVHGVLETAYRLWKEERFPFDWPYTPIKEDETPSRFPDELARNDLRKFGWDIENVLAQQNKRPRSRRARIAGYRRAHKAINLLGPHLFELVSVTEQKLIQTRDVPIIPNAPPRRSARYVLTGVVDVLTNVELSHADHGNVIREAIRSEVPHLAGAYEVIVDYKGSHRPRPGEPAWDQGEWQVQTYAWLRLGQPEARPVAAGILIYVNEWDPGATEARRLQRDLRVGDESLVLPKRGSNDWNQIANWAAGNKLALSKEFLYRRAIRVVAVDAASTDLATTKFDETVAQIEASVAHEVASGRISTNWKPTCENLSTCVACDFLTFCSDPITKATDPDDASDIDDPDEP